MADDYEPKILGFLCNWCSYSGADLAGTSRIQYPPTVRVIRVMCTGRIDPAFIVKAFAEGADGVLVSGCHPGECHYVTGNHKTEKRISFLHEIMEDLGIEKERLLLTWISASEGKKFAETIRDFTASLKKLGPSPVKIPA